MRSVSLSVSLGKLFWKKVAICPHDDALGEKYDPSFFVGDPS